MKGLSREGIPWKEYNLLHFVAAIPVALVLETTLYLFGRLSRVILPAAGKDVPENAILVTYHTEWPLYPATIRMWHRALPEWSWVGLHHFLSYYGCLLPFVLKARAIRFRRDSKEKPFPKIIQFLEENPKLAFAIRTDSGGPYEQVRHSIVAMAVKTGRPVVCIRQFATRALRLSNGHYIPLPFGTIRTEISRPFSAAELAALPAEEARLLLQTAMDSLRGSSES